MLSNWDFRTMGTEYSVHLIISSLGKCAQVSSFRAYQLYVSISAPQGLVLSKPSKSKGMSLSLCDRKIEHKQTKNH